MLNFAKDFFRGQGQPSLGRRWMHLVLRFSNHFFEADTKKPSRKLIDLLLPVILVWSFSGGRIFYPGSELQTGIILPAWKTAISAHLVWRVAKIARLHTLWDQCLCLSKFGATALLKDAYVYLQCEPEVSKGTFALNKAVLKSWAAGGRRITRFSLCVCVCACVCVCVCVCVWPTIMVCPL
jgi:hypothetical protein